MSEARRLAREYRLAMGKPLPGISAELAVHDATRLLDLEPAPAGAGGYDAVGRGARAGKRIQIKGRTIFDEDKGGQRIGQLKTEQEWDSVVLVLMDDNYEPFEVYEAERADVLEAVDKISRNRNKRGAVSVARVQKKQKKRGLARVCARGGRQDLPQPQHTRRGVGGALQDHRAPRVVAR